VIALTGMASSNLFFDDIRSKVDVDPPQNEESTDVGELVNDPAQTALKPNGTVSSSVRELLECPVCLNAMYPPIHQVVYILVCFGFLRESMQLYLKNIEMFKMQFDKLFTLTKPTHPVLGSWNGIAAY